MRAGGELRGITNWNLSETFLPFRFKVLANQYKAIYPTLKIDIEGELEKLKVSLLLSLRFYNHHLQLLIGKSLGDWCLCLCEELDCIMGNHMYQCWRVCCLSLRTHLALFCATFKTRFRERDWILRKRLVWGNFFLTSTRSNIQSRSKTRIVVGGGMFHCKAEC